MSDCRDYVYDYLFFDLINFGLVIDFFCFIIISGICLQIPVKTLNVKYGCQPTSPDKSIMPLQDQSSFNHKNDTVIPIINNDDKVYDMSSTLLFFVLRYNWFRRE